MAAWVLALGWLAKRELFRSTGARLAEAALSVPPGALFYRLDLGGQQIGFSSATLDTIPDSIRVEDVLVLDVPVLGRLQRTSARSVALLTRALRLQRVEVRYDGDGGRFAARGEVLGDSVLRVAIVAGETGDSQITRIPLTGPVTLPTLLPLRIAFGEVLEAGREYTVRVFDPPLLAERDVRVRVAAESTLIVADSADLDSTTMTWMPLRFDTVRAFRLDQTAPGGGAGAPLSAWVDAQGRVVRASTPLGFAVERTAFELAYDNFRRRDTARVARASLAPPAGAVVEATALAAGLPLPRSGPATLRVRLPGGSGLDLAGGAQTQSDDVVTVTAPAAADLRAAYLLPARDSSLARWLAPEPLIQVRDPRIVAQARLIVGRERNAAKAAEALLRWVHANVRKEPAIGVPGAVQVLDARRGDANEHTMLFVALARAVGLPARTAAGLVYLNGRFYYHAWPEVYLRDWVPVDPTFGQFPAAASHLRVAIGGLARHIELVRQIGRLKPEVL